jgi:biotin transporter BioY
MIKIIWSRILLGIGVALLVCYVGGLIYFYNFVEYNPYASAGAETDAFIHSVLVLPPTIICFLSSFILWIQHKKSIKR